MMCDIPQKGTYLVQPQNNRMVVCLLSTLQSRGRFLKKPAVQLRNHEVLIGRLFKGIKIVNDLGNVQLLMLQSITQFSLVLRSYDDILAIFALLHKNCAVQKNLLFLQLGALFNN